MKLEKFRTKPTLSSLLKILLISFVICILLNLWVSWAFARSRYPVSFIESQLSFSGELIKSHYAQMTQSQIQLYIRAQLVDYAYLCGYMVLFWSFSLTMSRFFLKDSKMRIIGAGMSYFGIFAALCDAVENIFILFMASNPLEFPNILGPIHSIFALLKFICIILIGLYVTIGFFFAIFQYIKEKRTAPYP